MASASRFPAWSVCVNSKIRRPIPRCPDAERVAAMFGLCDEEIETLYEQFPLEIAPGEIVAVTGPSGAGKSVLLREVARQVPRARWLRPDALARSDMPAVSALGGGDLAQRLGILARCGLAEALALITPAGYLSGGQLVRLALAEALHAALRSGRPELVIADEFGSCLDATTARILCRQIRKLVTGSPVAVLLATPCPELIPYLKPDQVVLKPLRRPARTLPGPSTGGGGLLPHRWRIERGTIRDYDKLACFHYLSGPPACHKRVYVIRPPGSAARRRWRDAAGAELAGVLIVSPPLPNVRGRNIATAGRYAGPDRAAALGLLNAEVECLSRVIVHPTYRGCGLAARLVRHALATAETPLVEALAAMGRIHPFLERAGMTPFHLPPEEQASRLLSAAEVVGLTPDELTAVQPVKKLLARRGSPKAAFLKRELDRCIRRTFSRGQLRRLADPIAAMCRRTARRYVYYLAGTSEDPNDVIS